MIQRVYEGTKKSTLISEVIVATDDERIFNEVVRFGGKAMMTKEAHPSGTDRCAEVALQVPEMDVVINIQGDELLVDYRQLNQLIDAFTNPETQIATLGNFSLSWEDVENPNRIKVVVNAAGKAMYFSRSAIPNAHHSSGNPLEKYPYMRHIGLYAYRAAILQELTNLQPTAIEKLSEGLQNGEKYQTLLGVTGSGKTFTIANVVEKVQKPTLVLAHNKTLAAQLFM